MSEIVNKSTEQNAKMIGWSGFFASVNTIGIRVVSAATTKGPRSFRNPSTSSSAAASAASAVTSSTSCCRSRFPVLRLPAGTKCAQLTRLPGTVKSDRRRRTTSNSRSNGTRCHANSYANRSRGRQVGQAGCRSRLQFGESSTLSGSRCAR
jgi:hypothetical protein